MPFPPRFNGAMQRSQKITFGEMRESGVRSVIISCADYRCAHSTTALADGWPDDMRLSDIEDRFVCKACGRRGAYVRPLFGQAPMGTDASKP
jgi:hypothetical protein